MADESEAGLRIGEERTRLAHTIDSALRRLSWRKAEIARSLGEEIKECYDREGVEALAWYASPHIVPSAQSGIWLREEGLHLAAQHLADPGPASESHLQLAFTVIVLHELFHAVVDRVLTTADDWLSMRDGQAARIYERHVRDVAPSFRGDGEPVEEAMANAFAFREFRSAASGATTDLDAVRQWMAAQPSGYKHFAAYVASTDFAAGTRVIGGRAIGSSKTRSASSTRPLEKAFFTQVAALSPFDIPTHLICDLTDPRASLFPAFPAGAEQAQQLQGAEQALGNVRWQVDGMRMAVTENGRRALEQLVGEATAAASVADRLAPRFERIDVNAPLGHPAVVWPLQPGSPSPFPPPDVAQSVRDAYEAAKSQIASVAKSLQDDLRWGMLRDLEEKSWRPDDVDNLELAIVATRRAFETLDGADVPQFAVRLW